MNEEALQFAIALGDTARGNPGLLGRFFCRGGALHLVPESVQDSICKNKHQVISNKPYKDKRITIAFDVVDMKKIKNMYKQYGEIDINSSFIPIY